MPDFPPVMLEAPAQELRPSDGAVLEIVVGAIVARIELQAIARESCEPPPVTRSSLRPTRRKPGEEARNFEPLPQTKNPALSHRGLPAIGGGARCQRIWPASP